MAAAKPKSKPKQQEVLFPQMSDHQFNQLMGLGMVFVAICIFIAFFSYLSTWKDDQSAILNQSAFDFLLNGEHIVYNSLGRLGALVSHLFFYRLFGVSSFALAALLLLAGIDLVAPRLHIPLRRYTFNVVLMVVILSLALGHFTKGSDFPYGGGFGTVLASAIYGFLGWGAPVLFVCLLVALFLYLFGIGLDEFLAQVYWVIQQTYEQFIQVFFSGKKNTSATANSTTFTKKEKAATPVAETDIAAEGVEDNTMTQIPKAVVNEEIDMQAVKSRGKNLIDVLAEQNQQNNPKSLHEDLMLDIEFSRKPAPSSPQSDTTPPPKTAADSKETADTPLFSPELLKDYDPREDLSYYTFPAVELLNDYGQQEVSINEEELKANKNLIVKTLSEFSIEIQKIKATVGSTITLYEIVPAPGVRIARIKSHEPDMALRLAALGIRIIAPIPGKGTIGIEVPNHHKEVVSLRSIIESEAFQNCNYDLPIALGTSITHGDYISDLAKMPHLLMAGATGQGKSVGINAILLSLLYKKHPSEIKFVMIDPKKVELSIYESIKNHYLAALPNEEDCIITDTKKVINTLNALCVEMDNRYNLLKNAAVRNVKEYNAKFTKRRLNPENGHQYLPYIILVIDEFADLIMTAGKDIELPLTRLAQLARAVGIHLVIATQRPTVNIITGTIKANFPVRIAFRVSSKTDSRTILDDSGAEQLIGRGDMLLLAGADTIRLQCAFVDTPEVERIIAHITRQTGYGAPFELPEYTADDSGGGKDGLLLQERDALFDEAAALIVSAQIGSTSLIQRKMKLGYNRAGRLMDQLEAAGVVGPNLGSKPREVLIKDLIDLEQFLNKISS